eukprot:GILK01016754.1.p2 GENE.GILK01016754.1~~GILK01016754.1.p2  ORF type:complete len:117 (+),score=4.47 GILK01016754.1:957-1307(+)
MVPGAFVALDEGEVVKRFVVPVGDPVVMVPGTLVDVGGIPLVVIGDQVLVVEVGEVTLCEVEEVTVWKVILVTGVAEPLVVGMFVVVVGAVVVLSKHCKAMFSCARQLSTLLSKVE